MVLIQTTRFIKIANFACLVLLLCSSHTFAQTEKNGFSLEAIGSFNLSAMNLDRAAIPSSGYGLFLLEKENPSGFFLGRAFGVQLVIPIGERWQVGTGLMYEVKGQSSSKIPSSRDPNVKFSHSFLISSYQMPLFARWYLKPKIWKCRQFVTATLAFDVYGKFTAQEYRYSPMFGKEKGSYEMLYFNESSHADNFKSHFGENLIRIGFGGGYGLSFDEIRFLTLKTVLEFRFYSDIFSNEIPFAIPGNGSLISLGLSLGLKSN